MHILVRLIFGLLSSLINYYTIVSVNKKRDEDSLINKTPPSNHGNNNFVPFTPTMLHFGNV